MLSDVSIEKEIQHNNLLIRRMENDDIPEVIKIEQTLFNPPWPEDGFSFEINVAYYSHPLVITQENNDNYLLGYAILWVLYEQAHLANIAVRKERQGMGIGRYLLDYIIADAKIHDCSTIHLEVRENNNPAISLYKSFGFVPIGKRRKYYENKFDALLMCCNLNQSGENI